MKPTTFLAPSCCTEGQESWTVDQVGERVLYLLCCVPTFSKKYTSEPFSFVECQSLRRIPTNIQYVYTHLPFFRRHPCHLSHCGRQPDPHCLHHSSSHGFDHRQLTSFVSKYTSRHGIDPEEFLCIVPSSKLVVEGFHGREGTGPTTHNNLDE